MDIKRKEYKEDKDIKRFSSFNKGKVSKLISLESSL